MPDSLLVEAERGACTNCTDTCDYLVVP
jgi:hypothetical protein